MQNETSRLIVSVFMITYNHEKFIKQALESILIQRTNFDFNIVVGEDCSTDNTRRILLEYKKNSEKFKLILHEKNIGAQANAIITFQACTGKYIALCEGDDYWTDPNKLQKQVDFLEANPNFIMCFHNADVIDSNNVLRKFNNYKKKTYKGEDLLKQWLIPTASVIFRNILPAKLPDYFEISTHGDLSLFLFLSQYGKLGVINETMSVYRINEQSITINEFKGIEHNEKHIEQCKQMIEYFKPKYKKLLEKRIADYLCSTAYLYSLEKNKIAIKLIKQAFGFNKLIIFKRFKYIAGTLFNSVKTL